MTLRAVSSSTPSGSKSPYILAQSAVPVCLVSSGTMGNNGALSAITALPTTYSGGIWLRLPANAIQAGSAAGLYWTVMSSTTAGTVYNVYADPASPFTPYIPAVNTPFVSTGPGAFTQTTASSITLVNITVPGGAIGPSGALRSSCLESNPNNANNKTTRILFGGTTLVSSTVTTVTVATLLSLLRNRSQSSQVHADPFGSQVAASYAGAVATVSSVNTAVDQSLVFTGQLTVATDFIVFEGFTAEVLPS